LKYFRDVTLFFIKECGEKTSKGFFYVLGLLVKLAAFSLLVISLYNHFFLKLSFVDSVPYLRIVIVRLLRNQDIRLSTFGRFLQE
jgi:hypothetical protein